MIHVQDIDATKRELIHQLLFQYCHVVDDGELSKWPDFFSDNGSYYVYSKENYDRGLPVAIIMDNHKGKIIDRVTLIKQIWTYNISYQRHMIANIRIEKSNGEKYHCHTNFSIYKTSREGKSELFAVGRYNDLIVFENNVPKIEKREVILDTSTLPSYFVRPL
ncbi:aromatic-ring-hydroxylating dioxygenase subunit beta [Paenibacillus validus]|nr:MULTISPECIES: aromatic-ring-hydroxylating dioxygenase subunit beta [Paenibacillus]MED4600623.1 aromatic-ring-hydroxylating dioxygenase subunit beta [Paenibacillus validus]MED4606256.1 aromatic-ring-hydroxylating dioxygenase subunit beta [Paenibacillus validus]